MKKENFYKKLVLGLSAIIGISGAMVGLYLSWKVALIVILSQLCSTIGIFIGSKLAIKHMPKDKFDTCVNRLISAINKILNNKQSDYNITKLYIHSAVTPPPSTIQPPTLQPDKKSLTEVKKKKKSKKVIKKTEK